MANLATPLAVIGRMEDASRGTDADADLPQNWHVMYMRDVATVKGGKRLPKGADFAHEPTPFPYIRIVDFADGSVRTDELRFLTPDIQRQISRYIIRQEDVYISIAGTIGLAGTVSAALDGANLTENAARLIINSPNVLDNGFLALYLRSRSGQIQIENLTAKTTQPKLALTRIEQIRVPVPPLPVQRAITRILRTVQEAIQARRREVEVERERKAALMQHLFTCGTRGEPTKATEIGEMPESWQVARLGDHAFRPEYGYTASATDQPLGPRFLRITDIQDGGVDWYTVPYCACDAATRRELRLAAGDIVIARIGATTGKSFLISDCPEAVFASYLIRVRAKVGLEPAFLHLFCQTETYWRQIDQTKGGRLKFGVNIPVLQGLVMPLPSPNEQHDIAVVLNACDAKIATMNQEATVLEELFCALLEELMTGRPSALALVEEGA
jgi:type I restriction enzyme, S subunit